MRVEDTEAKTSAAVQFGGNPTDTEVAALMAVLIAAASAHPHVPRSPTSSLGAWGNPTDQLRYGLTSAPVYFTNAHFSR
ncbi:acyl-CoA carboxylase subunit epsilon [Rhodococcus sp. BP-252]|uniref:acyl-CoA carboxylase subunit epsilon n=1 Tax=unclassified Rhodococcus (in: high G+C Gram-positive bacteria) TaxID=192944 RepID=UPI001C9A7D9F|nr:MULTISPECIES: acyl-CoA carboxylase subunit epsilon [unclassified Rhodococcus (in: high G+C Gram-positive bacteria)]MBY6410283.1 acyl-CoA carboxylase subunit epsilon [Rhodococcus sp. BP-320]MBY6416165.1 acyl-CoA carboxylase subunit epsilon [Rhodococcus sp. BP-321]MBY6424839.1 acyl-CoA carboxylase subunit epsilon [Rhodococcus sp. BP-323]MBY6430455.1 acyl-CoA carboxylase subunit epsilon [Rhodococcus sp. BP-322]MBY6439331.1 acyl-CoA carboxylase subunit epsilon [Rhodococcus sp. BP-319]